MLVVETIAKIRRAYFVQGKAIKAICRELRVSRKVVRKVMRSEATEFRYERESSRCRGLAPGGTNSTIADGELRQADRERLTLIRVFEELRGLGYEGGYDAVRRYAQVWRRERAIKGGNALCAAELCAGRSLPVRLEPRDRRDQRCDDDA